MKRQQTPFLLLDGGDALFKSTVIPPGDPGTKETTKAELIISCMGGVGYNAMAVGERDLVFGYDALVAKAKAANLTLMSANLMKDGKPAFEPRKLFKVGGHSVGVFALSMAPAAVPATGLTRADPQDTAKEQVAALKKEGAELIVVLGHLDNIEATDVLNHVEGIDFMVNAHTGRVGQPQAIGHGFILPSGERGRQVMRLDLTLNGNDKFVDMTQMEDAKRRVDFLTTQIQSMKDRAKREPQNAASLNQSAIQLEKQKADAEKLAAAKPEGRSFRPTTIVLDPTVAFEEPTKRRVDAFVAKYGATN